MTILNSIANGSSGKDVRETLNAMIATIASLPAPTFATSPSVTPATGTTATTFTANDGVIASGLFVSRRWLLGGAPIGTGATVSPGAAGNLVLEVTAINPISGKLTVSTTPAITVGAAVTAPAAPTLSATPGNGQIILAWTDGANGGAVITGHKLYAGTAPGSMTLVGTITSASPYIDAAANGVTRYYALSAVNSANLEGPTSAIASATPFNSVVTPPAAPSIASSSDNATYTATPGVWPSGTTISGKWYRDGAAISPAVTSLTYTRVSANDDGRYIQYIETANGQVTSASNALLAGASTTTYATSFAGSDGTSLNNFEGWASYGTSSNYLQIASNDLVQIAPSGGVKFLHATASPDFEFEVKIGYPVTGTDGTNSFRYFYGRFTDDNNYVQLRTQNNGYALSVRVSGQSTTLLTFGSRTIADGAVVKVRFLGNYLRVFFNGAEASESAAANGGLGFLIDAVPKVAMVGFGGAGSVGGATFPFPVARDSAIYDIPATAISIGAMTVSQVASTPGRQVINIPVATQGSISQIQLLLMSSTGRVLSDWANVSPVSGVVTSPEVTAAAEGDQVRVWLRDSTSKATATAATILVPVNWRAIPAEFGINLNGTVPFSAGIVPSDFFKSGELRLSDYKTIADPSITSTNDNYPPASTVGLDLDGWPTITPSGKQVMICVNDGGKGFTAEAAGTYDVYFSPGQNWTINGSASWGRTAFNVAAGTATIVVNAGVANQPTCNAIFVDYNGTPGAFPPAGQRYFYSVKRGEDATTFLTAKSLSSIKSLTSASAYTENGFKGYTRFMTPGSINRAAIAGITYNFTRKRNPKTRLAKPAFSGDFALEDQLAVCVANRSHMWLNIPDTMTSAEVTAVATYLKENMPFGMRVAVEYSNEIYFNTANFFTQTYGLLDRAAANGIGAYQQYARDAVSVVFNQFEAVFGFNDARYFPVVGIAAVAATAANLALLLNEGNLWQRVKGVCTAPYIGGGVAGKSVANYTEQSIFTKASRDKAGVDNTGFLTDLFAAQQAMSQIVRDQSWNPFCNYLAQYSVSKGKDRAYLMPMCYEVAWQHFDMKNGASVSNWYTIVTGSITGTSLTVTANGGPTLRPNDVLVGTGITLGTKVISGPSDGGPGTYVVDTNHSTATGSITISTSTNIAGNAAGQLIAQALRDPRAGAAQVEQIKWLRATGGIHCLFDHIGPNPTNLFASNNSNWGLEDSVGR